MHVDRAAEIRLRPNLDFMRDPSTPDQMSGFFFRVSIRIFRLRSLSATIFRCSIPAEAGGASANGRSQRFDRLDPSEGMAGRRELVRAPCHVHGRDSARLCTPPGCACGTAGVERRMTPIPPPNQRSRPLHRVMEKSALNRSSDLRSSCGPHPCPEVGDVSSEQTAASISERRNASGPGSRPSPYERRA